MNLSTTSVEEIKGNIQVLGNELVRCLQPNVEVECWQERATMERAAGPYTKEMRLEKFFEHRNAYIRAYDLSGSPLNKMDTAYMHAQAISLRESWHIVQNLLHEIDKLSLLLSARQQDGPVVVSPPTKAPNATGSVDSLVPVAVPVSDELSLENPNSDDVPLAQDEEEEEEPMDTTDDVADHSRVTEPDDEDDE